MQLTDAKLLNADALMLMAYGHSDMNDMSALRTGWRPSLTASSVPHTQTIPGQDVHARRRLPGPQLEAFKGIGAAA